MMRLLIKQYQQIILLIVAFLFTACSSDEPNYVIDPGNYYYFNKGDTLRYIGESGIDSFVVVKAERYINHRSNEQFDIEVRQINEENSVYSGGYVFIFSYYYRIAFRNIDYEERLDLVDYISLDSLNVIKIKSTLELLDSNVFSIYYNFNYGLIKYELKNGETFTIDEELLRR